MRIINFLRYFIEFLIIIFFFIIFKILGVKLSSYISGKIFCLIGPFFRSKDTILYNLKIVLPNLSNEEEKMYMDKMWN